MREKCVSFDLSSFMVCSRFKGSNLFCCYGFLRIFKKALCGAWLLYYSDYSIKMNAKYQSGIQEEIRYSVNIFLHPKKKPVRRQIDWFISLVQWKIQYSTQGKLFTPCRRHTICDEDFFMFLTPEKKNLWLLGESANARGGK